MKKLGIKLLIITSLFCFNRVNAQPGLGGEITWACVGQDSFLVKVIVYRDCNAVNLWSIQLRFKCATSGATITTTTTSPGTGIDITPVCNSSCTRCQSFSCTFPYGIQKYTMQKLVNLSAAGNCCNVDISWEWWRIRVSTTDEGPLYLEAKLNRCQNPCDNSPEFTNTPVMLLCKGQDFIYNHGVVDMDVDSAQQPVDSLTYEWTPPLYSSTTYATYIGQYTYQQPIYFYGFPNSNLAVPQGFHLNAQTGDIRFRPMKAESTVMAIKVKEYRNGVKIGEVSRDLVFIVINCPSNYPPFIINQNNSYSVKVCADDTIRFNFTCSDPNSNDTLSLSWNNSISNATWQANNGQTKRPSASLTWVPAKSDISVNPYYFKVTVRDNACPLNARSTQTFQILVQDNASVNYSISDSGCGLYKFNATAPNYPGISYHWVSSSGGINNHASSFIHQFGKPGTHPVSLSLTSNNYCPKLFYDTIVTDTFLWAQHSSNRTICRGDTVHLSIQAMDATGKIRYKWCTGDTLPAVTVKPDSSTYYSFEVFDATNCSFKDSIYISVNQLPQLTISNDTSICQKQQVNLRVSGAVKYKWNTGEQTTLNRKYPIISTWYRVTGTDQNNCAATDSVLVTVRPNPITNAGADTTVCAKNGLYQLKGKQDNIAGGAVYWSGSYVTKTDNNIWYFDPGAGGIIHKEKYQILYHYTDSTGCSNTDTTYITVNKYSTANAGPDKKHCINGGLLALNGTPAGGNWSGKGVTGNYFDPVIAGLGTQKLIYQVYDFCDFSDTTFVAVYPYPNVTVKTYNEKTEFCPGRGFIQLIGKPAGGVFSGDFEPGNYFNTNMPEGLYYILYFYKDNNGCSFGDTLRLRIRQAEIDINALTDYICDSGSILLNSSYRLADSINWIKEASSNGGFSGAISDPQIIFTPGSNDFSNGGCWIWAKTFSRLCKTKTDSVYIKAGYHPKTDFSADPITGSFPLEVTFTDLSGIQNGNIAEYSWDFGDGYRSNIQNPKHTYPYTGLYDVSLFTVSDIGCRDSLLRKNYIQITNSIEAGINGTHIYIYPNPAHDFLFIENKRSENIKFAISDMYGRNFSEKNVAPGINKLNIQSFKPGIYFIFVNGMVAGKILIE